MFYLRPNASKVAFYYLIEQLKQQQFELLDTQFINDNVQRYGAIEIPGALYAADGASLAEKSNISVSTCCGVCLLLRHHIINSLTSHSSRFPDAFADSFYLFQLIKQAQPLVSRQPYLVGGVFAGSFLQHFYAFHLLVCGSLVR
jgi:hypothetical protein